MAEYKIRKQGREFTANQLETVAELAERGLLQPGDPVSVDGGEWQPASEVEELAEVLANAPATPVTGADPWRHFDQTEEEDDGVLASFLDSISTGPTAAVPAARPKDRPARPEGPAPSHIAKVERVQEVSSLSSGLGGGLGPRPVRTRSEEHLPMIDAEPLPPDAPPDALEELPPLDQEEEEDGAATSSSDAVTLTEVPRAEPDGDVPVSFTEWLEKRDSGQAKPLLEGFGRYDDGIFVPKMPGRESFNIFRVLAVVLLGVVVVGAWYIWVKTVAEAEYPLESEIVAARQPPPNPGGTRGVLDRVDSGPGVITPEEGKYQIRLRRIRVTLAGQIRAFHTPGQLEDAFFSELVNRSVGVKSISVDSISEQGTADYDERKPTQANLTIKLTGASSIEQLESYLMLTWLLVGKYSEQGGVRFEDVQIVVGGDIPWDRRHDGRILAALWAGRVTPESLFSGEN